MLSQFGRHNAAAY